MPFNGYHDRHPDWRKPPFPYKVGAKIQVRAHKPPSLSPMRWPIDSKDVAEWEDFSPLERCLKHPPPPGTYDKGSASLEILESIYAADEKNAQLVLVRVRPGAKEDVSGGKLPSSLPPESTLVAKFYDPLYYDHDQHDSDPFKNVNSSYLFEVGAYTRLSNMQGTAIPKFYGSFTTSFPVPIEGMEEGIEEGQTREVRLILMEFIRGSRMLDANPQDYTQQQRQDIMGSVVDADTTIYANDIMLLDLYPRNVMLPQDNQTCKAAPGSTQSPSRSQTRPAVLIDFDTVHLGRNSPGRLSLMGEQYYMPGTVISPILRWAQPRKYNRFAAWVDWNWEEWIAERYARDKPTITEEMKKIWG